MEILLSIIIPVYNVEKYVAQCVESIISQAEPDMELIAVDDGSTDDSGHICDTYALRYPDTISVIHKKNGGLSDARNTGMSVARGKYVFFVDSDDFIESDALGTIRDAISGFGFPDMVLFDSNKVRETGEVFETSRLDIPHSTVLCVEDERRLMFTAHSAWNRVVLRSLYTDNNILFPNGIWYEDLCVTPRLVALSGAVVYISRPLINYRVRAGSIMSSRQLERKVEIITAFSKLMRWYHDYELYEHFKMELEFLAIYNVMFYASLDIIKADASHSGLASLREYVIGAFPLYRENEYLSRLSPVRRLILRMIICRWYRFLHILFRMKTVIHRVLYLKR